MVNTAPAEFKQALVKENLWKTLRVFILSIAEHHGRGGGEVTESTTVLGPSLAKGLWIVHHSSMEAGEFFQLAQAFSTALSITGCVHSRTGCSLQDTA